MKFARAERASFFGGLLMVKIGDFCRGPLAEIHTFLSGMPPPLLTNSIAETSEVSAREAHGQNNLVVILREYVGNSGKV